MNITFSLDQLNNILRKLRGNEKDQFTGLDSLATMLIYGGGAQLSRLPCSELCALLVNILRTTNKEKYREMAALCIFHVLEVHPGTFQFFMQQNLLAIFDSLINPSSSNDFLENSIQALSSFAKISPFDIGKRGTETVCAAQMCQNLRAWPNAALHSSFGIRHAHVAEDRNAK